MFRSEAMDHARIRTHGTIVLAQPLSHVALAWLLSAVVLASFGFAASFSVTRKAVVPGEVVPRDGLLRVLPLQAGVITARRVHDGQAVHAGDVLFVLSSDRASASFGDAQERVSSLLTARRDSLEADRTQQRLQDQARLDAARRRIDDLRAEGRRLDAEIALQQRRVALAQGALKRDQDLLASNFVSSAQVDDRQAAWIDQRQRLADLERSRASAARDEAAAQSDADDLTLQLRRDDEAAQRGIDALSQDLTESEAQRGIVVRAPRDGTVTALNGHVGQVVPADLALAAIVPAGSPFEADLYVPSGAIGFLKPGQSVRVRYDAFPYQKFGQFTGTVREVARSGLTGAELAASGHAVPAGTGAEPLYPVRVALARQAVAAYGHAEPLRAGMRLQASVVLERRRLIDWLLDPLYSFTGRT